MVGTKSTLISLCCYLAVGMRARALARATCYFSKHVRWLLVLAGVIIGGSPYLAGAENGGNRSVPAIRT